MSDTDDTDDDAPTFYDMVDDLFAIGEQAVEDIKSGIEQADEDHPMEPANPFERIREQMDRMSEDSPVVIDVEKELETLREQMGGDLSDAAEDRAADGSEFEFVGDDAEPYTDAELAAEIEDIAANLQAAANGLKDLHRSLERREDD